MKPYVLANGRLWIGDGTAYEGYVVVADGLIDSVGSGRYGGGLPAVDLGDAALSPGMIDLMVLGGFDKSVMRDDVFEITQEYLRLGVTSCQLSFGTLPWEAMAKVADNARRGRAYQGDDATGIIGLYPEGPFQHPDFTGASKPEYVLAPTNKNVSRFLKQFGDIVTMINVSPGTQGDAQAVGKFREAGCTVTMAHSCAPAERVKTCVDAGTSVLGHAWDNNSALIGDSGVPQPTIEEVALTDERVKWLHLLCDGSHVHPIMMDIMLRCRGIDAICLITDCTPKAGCPDGPVLVWLRSYWHLVRTGRLSVPKIITEARLVCDLARMRKTFSGLTVGISDSPAAIRAFARAKMKPVIVGVARVDDVRGFRRTTWSRLAAGGLKK